MNELRTCASAAGGYSFLVSHFVRGRCLAVDPGDTSTGQDDGNDL